MRRAAPATVAVSKKFEKKVRAQETLLEVQTLLEAHVHLASITKTSK